MALVISTPVQSFDLNEIKVGDLIWAKHSSWSDGKAGFVTSAKKDQLIVQYHPGISNVTNHFIIPVAEAVEEEWEIRWSEDMSVVNEYNVKAEGEGGDESE